MKVKIPTVIGSKVNEDIYLGRIIVKGVQYAILQPPKAIAFHEPTPWNDSNAHVKGALSYHDGLANTKAMSKAGSKLAQWALDNGLYIPAIDEQDLQYRALKPTADKNSCWARSGINLNSLPQHQPYTPDSPKQTKLKACRAGGSEAIEPAFHWSSTQHASFSDYAWGQDFTNGYQGGWSKDGGYRALAVRRLAIK